MASLTTLTDSLASVTDSLASVTDNEGSMISCSNTGSSQQECEINQIYSKK